MKLCKVRRKHYIFVQCCQWQTQKGFDAAHTVMIIHNIIFDHNGTTMGSTAWRHLEKRTIIGIQDWDNSITPSPTSPNGTTTGSTAWRHLEKRTIFGIYIGLGQFNCYASSDSYSDTRTRPKIL